MSKKKYANRRDDNEPEVIEALEQIGARVWRLDEPGDLVVDFRRMWWMIEVKNPDGRNRMQESQKELFKTDNPRTLLVRSGMDAIEQINEVGG